MAKKEQVSEQIQDFYQKIYTDLEEKTLNDPFGSYLLNRVKSGQKKTYNKTQIELRDFDMSFLDVIESTYPALIKIMKTPKKSIRYEQEIVAVEKAKKVNSDTVRHLSSHTHLIKEIKDSGDVIPGKVLTTYAEEELAIYENRFIKSLVKRIEIFLERRYEVMKVSLESIENHHLNVQNEFLVSGQTVQVELDISVKNSFSKDLEGTKAQYQRLVYVRELIQGLKGTEFMRELAKAKDIFPPIMKTNVILHNPDFKMCYNLWLYLDKTDGIAFNVNVGEKNYRYTTIMNTDMNEIMTLAVASFLRSRDIADVVPSKLKAVLKEPKPIENKDISEIPTLEPSSTKLEDYRLNEFLLNQTAKYYEANYNGLQRTGSSESESLRVIYRQMLEMLDQIYPRVFDVSEERLSAMDNYQRLDYARKRLQVLNIVQKQKQMNIARMGKEQKKMESQIDSLERRIKLQEAKVLAQEKKKREKELKAQLSSAAKKEAEEKAKQRIRELLEKKKNNEKK